MFLNLLFLFPVPSKDVILELANLIDSYRVRSSVREKVISQFAYFNLRFKY